MIRLFVAIQLPEDLRRRMGALAGGVPSARWVAEDNLHLTLRFIGEVGEDRLEDITAALATVKGVPFPMNLSGVGHFESRRRARTLWVGIEPNAELEALYDRVESALVRAGLEPESRKFSAHVTMARLKNVAVGKVTDWLAMGAAFHAPPVRVDGFTLLSSFLSRSGAIYSTVQEFPLGAFSTYLEPAPARSPSRPPTGRYAMGGRVGERAGPV